MGVSDTGIGGAREFPITSWTVIRGLQDPNAPEYREHLQRLVSLYWKPVYCAIRASWAREDAAAKDLTQEFFAEVVMDRGLVEKFQPTRGSFRGFLRTALSNFLSNQVRDQARQKRGGGVKFLTLDDAGDVGELMSGVDAGSPDRMFDATWNNLVVSRALDLLEDRLLAEGRKLELEVFKQYDLLMGRDELSYGDLGRELGVTTDQVRHALVYARNLLRTIMVDIVRGYVDSDEDLAAELRELMGG